MKKLAVQNIESPWSRLRKYSLLLKWSWFEYRHWLWTEIVLKNGKLWHTCFWAGSKLYFLWILLMKLRLSFDANLQTLYRRQCKDSFCRLSSNNHLRQIGQLFGKDPWPSIDTRSTRYTFHPFETLAYCWQKRPFLNWSNLWNISRYISHPRSFQQWRLPHNWYRLWPFPKWYKWTDLSKWKFNLS